MIKIIKASSKDNFTREWNAINIPHYGKEIRWTEKPFSFKAVENGKMIGKIEGKYESGVINIATIMITSNARGRGVGTMLINKAEEYGKKQGAHRTWLVTGKHWTENLFYKKLGFDLIATIPDFYFHTDFVIYTRLIK
jgi:ribosomal protein S18 acetylase RimI-like enzyme